MIDYLIRKNRESNDSLNIFNSAENRKQSSLINDQRMFKSNTVKRNLGLEEKSKKVVQKIQNNINLSFTNSFNNVAYE
jgi:hypothetical protein